MRTQSAAPPSVTSVPSDTIRPRAEEASATDTGAIPPQTRPDAEDARLRESGAPLLSERVRIELDAEANRYVQKTLDPVTKEVIDSFPAEAQLRFSRAISAYLRAQSAAGVNDS